MQIKVTDMPKVQRIMDELVVLDAKVQKLRAEAEALGVDFSMGPKS